jgi:hypothetical protein
MIAGRLQIKVTSTERGEEIMKTTLQKKSIFIIAILSTFLLGLFFNQSGESARRYQYQVISITGMTELRTQSDSGKMKTIEKIVNDQAAQGWELYQADGYILYFRR